MAGLGWVWRLFNGLVGAWMAGCFCCWLISVAVGREPGRGRCVGSCWFHGWLGGLGWFERLVVLLIRFLFLFLILLMVVVGRGAVVELALDEAILFGTLAQVAEFFDGAMVAT